MMADFRNGGVDSRFFGPVSKDEIQGPVITIVRRNRFLWMRGKWCADAVTEKRGTIMKKC